jgi:hypothetical protein
MEGILVGLAAIVVILTPFWLLGAWLNRNDDWHVPLDKPHPPSLDEEKQ